MCFSNIETFRRFRKLFTYFILKRWHVQDWVSNVVLSLYEFITRRVSKFPTLLQKKYWICSFLVIFWVCFYEEFICGLVLRVFSLFCLDNLFLLYVGKGENTILRSWDLYAVSLCGVMHYTPLVEIIPKLRFLVGLLGLGSVIGHRSCFMSSEFDYQPVDRLDMVRYLCLSFLSAGSRGTWGKEEVTLSTALSPYEETDSALHFIPLEILGSRACRRTLSWGSFFFFQSSHIITPYLR